MSRPVVALVGRPNVGKSTLFNVLAGERISIVKDTPGVTRDRIYTDTNWRGRDFTVIDTGGLEPDSNEEMLVRIREQAQIAIESADVIVFITDVKTGPVDTDSRVAELLRRSGKNVVLAVNKVDSFAKYEMDVYEFYSLGMGDPVAISAGQRLGLGDLMDEVVKFFPPETDESGEDVRPRIAIVGRPNAGKSSIINRLLGENRLIVSDVAGTTRDAVDTPVVRNGQEYVLTDTAGLRRKNKVKEELEHFMIIRTVTAVERSDVAVIVIDAAEGVAEQDAKIAGIAHDRGKASVIAVNKWDLVEKDDRTMNEYKKNIESTLSFMPYADMVFISAKSGQRLNKLFDAVDRAIASQTLRIPTGVLNEVISQATALREPPTDKGKRLRIFYSVQVSVKPPTFVLFVNSKELMHFSYTRYLENRIRESFGFVGTPLRFIIRERERDKD